MPWCEEHNLSIPDGVWEKHRRVAHREERAEQLVRWLLEGHTLTLFERRVVVT